MKEFDDKSFIEVVETQREEDTDTCEYEVTKKAMESYEKYPCYNDWTSILHGNTIYNYMRNPNAKHKDGYRGNGAYIGANLLVCPDKERVLTADILTSKGVPLDLCERHLSESQQIFCKPYIALFENVYYWCGNMMPMICNFSPGRGDSASLDNWKVKMELIVSIVKKSTLTETEKKEFENFKKGNGSRQRQKQLWPGWLSEYWNNNMIRGAFAPRIIEIIWSRYLKRCFQKLVF